MNLLDGRIMNAEEAAEFMKILPHKISETISKPLLHPLLVIDVCDKLASMLTLEMVLPILEGLGMTPHEAKTQFEKMKLMFSKPFLLERLQVELGLEVGVVKRRVPLGLSKEVEETLYPLGVLFHIAAGNMDGLPVYTVIEGLLTGNINLLKLPQVDGGLSVMILQQMFVLQPILQEYVYVFELSSKEIDSMRQLASMVDGIVVWGGDEAVQSVRNMAPANTKIIEWGHKLSFAFVSPKRNMAKELEGLAHNICATNQLLCSSCQGVFIDTEDMEEVQGFCEKFLRVLEKVSKEYPPVPLSASAQATLQLYTRQLEDSLRTSGRKVFRGDSVSITAAEDSVLELSLQFRNVWVRPLPREKLIERLSPYKNYLQTAALICKSEEWAMLSALLWRTGVVHVSNGAQMSEMYCGAAHDGEYPLQRYTRKVSAKRA